MIKKYSPPHIVFYNGVFSQRGGIEEFTADLVETLLQENWRVTIVCASRPHPLLDKIRRAGGEIHRMPWVWGCRWKFPETLLLIWGWLFARSADLLIFQKTVPAWHLAFLGKRAKRLYISSYHPGEQFAGLPVSSFFSKLDAFFVQADAFADALPDLGFSGKISVIPLIPPDFGGLIASDLPVEGPVRVGMMGRLEDQKNPLYAAQIVAALQTQHPAQQWEFHIYGDGKLREKMTEYCAALNVNTVLHGRYDRSQLFDLIAQNHFYIITSRTEGQCIAALEILAVGRPLFATAVGALPEILSRAERGSLLPADDPGAAAKTISAFLERPNALDARNISVSFLDSYSVEVIKARYCSEISKIITS